MKALIIAAVMLLMVSAGQAQTSTQRYRIDTLTASAGGGVNDWKPCKMTSIGRSYTLSAMPKSTTADIRVAVTWRDTVTNKGGIIPYISGVTTSSTLPSVVQTEDTVWIKGPENAIIVLWKF